jgi:hypothetical protein
MSKRVPPCTAFVGPNIVASGSLEEVTFAVRELLNRDPTIAPLVFDDATARPIDLDLRDTDDTVQRPPGRPKLGVVAREVTLLPRHWDWLNRQPGGASVALRQLIDEARHASPVADRLRLGREATYRFMTAMAGNEPGYDAAATALFAGDGPRYYALIKGWPEDIRFYAGLLAADAFEEEPS